MGDLAARLADYGLTLDEHVVICDRRVVDEAVAALSAASPAPSLPEDVERVVARLEEPHHMDRLDAEAAALIRTLSSQLAEARAEIERLTPLAVAYDYLESPAGREVAEADRDRLAAENEKLREREESAREFVKRHPALSLIDLAEFEAFLKVPAALASLEDRA